MIQIKKVCLAFACMALSLMAVACGGSNSDEPANVDANGDVQQSKEKRIESFYYEYGSEETGYYTYNITPQKDMDSVLISISSRTDPEKNAEKSVDSSLIDDLDKLINDNKLNEWDSFDETDNGSVDGYSFQLSVSYENGETITAKGYESYPENKEDYQAKHDAILALLDSSVK